MDKQETITIVKTEPNDQDVLATLRHADRTWTARVDWGTLHRAAEQQDPFLRTMYARILEHAEEVYERNEAARIERELYAAVADVPLAKKALAVGKTRVAGDVRGALGDYLMTPDGGWPQTVERYQQAVNAVAHAAGCSWDEAINATATLLTAAQKAGYTVHPSRFEE